MSEFIEVDVNGDGVDDLVQVTEYGDGSILSQADTNGDGLIDVAAYDEDGDGVPEVSAEDTNYDGEVDVVVRNQVYREPRPVRFTGWGYRMSLPGWASSGTERAPATWRPRPPRRAGWNRSTSRSVTPTSRSPTPAGNRRRPWAPGCGSCPGSPTR